MADCAYHEYRLFLTWPPCAHGVVGGWVSGDLIESGQEGIGIAFNILFYVSSKTESSWFSSVAVWAWNSSSVSGFRSGQLL